MNALGRILLFGLAFLGARELWMQYQRGELLPKLGLSPDQAQAIADKIEELLLSTRGTVALTREKFAEVMEEVEEYMVRLTEAGYGISEGELSRLPGFRDDIIIDESSGIAMLTPQQANKVAQNIFERKGELSRDRLTADALAKITKEIQDGLDSLSISGYQYKEVFERIPRGTQYIYSPQKRGIAIKIKV